MKPTIQNRQLPQHLKSADYYNDFLIRAAKNEVKHVETKLTKVEARLNSVPLKQIDERTVVIAFTKIITDIFEYFNTNINDSILSIIISDIIDDYGIYSALEIYKALHEGRRKQRDLFGKLSGLHLTKWLNDYFAEMGDELAEYRRNEKFEREKELDNLHIPEFKRFAPDPVISPAKEKRQFTPEQKAAAFKSTLTTDKEQMRREYSREWNYNQHGDYKAYMDKFDYNV